MIGRSKVSCPFTAVAAIEAARCRKAREQELADKFMEELVEETQG